MDLGKFKYPVSQSYLGDQEAALKSMALAFSALNSELAVTAGIALLPASVAIARGLAVNINSGQLRLADASLNRPAIGICIGAAGAGEKARIILGMGYAGELAGLTANSSVYLGNAGALLFVKPGAGMIQGLGWALSATEMFVTISQP